MFIVENYEKRKVKNYPSIHNFKVNAPNVVMFCIWVTCICAHALLYLFPT